HVVVTQIQTFLLDDPACAGVGPHVEAEQHRIGRQRQVGIAFGDTTDAAANDAHLHFIVTQAAERALQGFQRTADIGFEDDIERLLLFLPHALEDVFQLAGVGTGELDLAELALTEQGHFTGLLLVAQHAELVTGLGRTVQAENLHRNRRSGFLDGVAVLVEHRADATVGGTNQSHIALTQRTVLYQYGCYRTAALVETRLNHYTAARRRRRGRELKQFRLQQYRFEQFVDTGPHLRRHRHERRITAPFLGNHIKCAEAVLDVVRVGLRLVDLVHRNHDRHASGFRMLDGFLGLRHHAIVGRDHQNHDIGRLGTTGTHGGERRVARGIEEGDHPALGFYVVGTDSLGNPPRLAHGDLGATDVVEQRGLAVVDVPHHGHDRRAGNGVAFEPQVFGQLLFQGVVADQLDLVAQLFGDQLGSFLIQHLVDGYRRTHLEHELDDFRRLDRHLLRQIGNRDGFADRHFAHDGAGGALEAMGVALLQLGLATTATAMTFIFFTRARGASERRLRLERRPMLSLLAITTLVVIVARFLGATRFFLLTLLDRSGRHFGLYRSRRCGNRRNHRRPCTGLGFGLRLATGLFLGALTRFFLGLQTSRFLSGALLFQLALLLGLDLLGTA